MQTLFVDSGATCNKSAQRNVEKRRFAPLAKAVLKNKLLSD